MDYTPEQLEDKFNLLPENVRKTLTSVHVEEHILSIGRSHKLHVDILDELADETGLVMLGLTHPRNYVEHLSERLGISNDEAVSLARDVNAQIFSPIRESLKKVHGLRGGGEERGPVTGEIGGAIPTGRVGDGDIAALEARRERLIRGERAPTAPTAIHEEKLAGPVRRPPERIDLNAAHDPYRERIEDADVRAQRG